MDYNKNDQCVILQSIQLYNLHVDVCNEYFEMSCHFVLISPSNRMCPVAFRPRQLQAISKFYCDPNYACSLHAIAIN